MAITAVPALSLPGLQTLPQGGTVVFAPGDVQEPVARCIATITGDGSTLTAVVNFIDGTKTLAFTPSYVTARIVNGGTDTAGVLKVAAPGPVSSISATSCTLTFTTAIGSAATVNVLLELFA